MVASGCGKNEVGEKSANAAVKQETATSATSAGSGSSSSTAATSNVTVYVPKDEDQIVKVVRLEATGAAEADACNQIIDNGTRAASFARTGWGMVTVKGGGACACEKKEGYYACARDVYLGKLSTGG
jgi:hypothetical protein